MKFISLGALAASAVITFGVGSAALAADYTLSVNTALATSDPLYKGLEAFRDNVATASDGAIEVKLFPKSQLGADEEAGQVVRGVGPSARDRDEVPCARVVDQERIGAGVHGNAEQGVEAGALLSHVMQQRVGRAGVDVSCDAEGRGRDPSVGEHAVAARSGERGEVQTMGTLAGAEGTIR